METTLTVNASRAELVVSDENASSSVVNESGADVWLSSSLTSTVQIVTVVLILTVIAITTVVGNVLVIMSVFTYKPLRIVQNFFIVSLAVADLTVAILVMPLNIVYTVLGRWVLGLVVCEMWLTCDVLCCTASILNLCAIALDRYWAITDPINYAQKRTFKRVVLMIVFVWAVSGVICLPPLIGWNDWPDDFNESNPCRLTETPGYIVYSSCGSFYIPLLIMTLVYVKIFVATRKRLRDRAKASKISVAQKLAKPASASGARPLERTSSFTPSEDNHNEDTCTDVMMRKEVASDRSDDSSDRTTSTKFHGDVPTETRCSSTIAVATDDSSGSKDLLHHKDSRSHRHQPRDGAKNRSLTATIPQFIEERQKISLSKERRAARTLGIIMGVFVVCWLPFFLMYVILPFCQTCHMSPELINFVTWLGYINSTLNPVIYTIFNVDFRTAFARLLNCSK